MKRPAEMGRPRNSRQGVPRAGEGGSRTGAFTPQASNTMTFNVYPPLRICRSSSRAETPPSSVMMAAPSRLTVLASSTCSTASRTQWLACATYASTAPSAVRACKRKKPG